MPHALDRGGFVVDPSLGPPLLLGRLRVLSELSTVVSTATDLRLDSALRDILTIRLYFHIVADTALGDNAIVSQQFCFDAVEHAAQVWRQACIAFAATFAGYVAGHRSLEGCGQFYAESDEMLEIANSHDEPEPPEERHGPPPINAYFMDRISGQNCASVGNGRVWLVLNRTYPGVTQSENVGLVLAHEIGHLLLNPTVDDSPIPGHLMHHAAIGRGLYLEDCVLARDNTARLSTTVSQESCPLMPLLGVQP